MIPALIQALRGLQITHDVLPFAGAATPDSRVLVVTGPNASGKSLLLRVMSQVLKDLATPDTIEVLRIGMEFRTSPGVQRAFVFAGEERDSSTGALSVHAALGALRTSRNRTSPHIIALDEPDVGLSEGLAAGLGTTLGAYAADLPEHAQGLLLATHSRRLVRSLSRCVPITFLHMGRSSVELESWLATEEPEIDPANLYHESMDTMRTIAAWLKAH